MGRIILILNVIFNFNSFNLVLFILINFICFASILLIRQVDFKSLVAYSSVLHITFCAVRLLAFNFIRNFGRGFIRICHRFISPLIFLFIYYFYQHFGSRKIIANSSFSLILKRTFTFTYLLNLRFPLLGRFLSELLIFNLILSKDSILLAFISLLGFILPIIFTFSIISSFSKYYSLNFRISSSFIQHSIGLRIILISLFLVYSFIIL